MSPLARIRQVAAAIFLLLVHCALAADPPSQAAQKAEPPPAVQSAPPVSQPLPATAASQPAPTSAPAPGAGTISTPQPPQAVVLAPKATALISRSALLVVEGTAAPESLLLKIRRAHDGSLITSGAVTVTVDGKNEAVTHDNAGTYEVPIDDLRGDGSNEAAKDVDIVVAHDGIREILSGKVAVPEAPSGRGLLGDHKQLAWWILNIAVVLIAAIAISRRKS